MDIKELKKESAFKAVEQIKSGMIVGLGSGSTTLYAIKRIGELIDNGTLNNIVGIATSVEVENEAKELGIPLSSFDEHTKINLTIDGADEVDENLNLIKGGGGALLREKVVAQASEREIIIVDETKISKHLGEKWSVPIEVLKFAAGLEKEYLESIGGKVKLRTGDSGGPYITDEGNYIFDTNFGVIGKPNELAQLLQARAGIVEHGIFINLADEVIVSSHAGINSLKKK